MDIPASQPVSQPQLRSAWPLRVSWVFILVFMIWGLVGVFLFESMLSNFYFLMFWVLTMIVEVVLLLSSFVRSCIDFFRARKIGDAVLKKKAFIRLVCSFLGVCALPFLLIFLGLMLLSLAPGLKY